MLFNRKSLAQDNFPSFYLSPNQYLMLTPTASEIGPLSNFTPTGADDCHYVDMVLDISQPDHPNAEQVERGQIELSKIFEPCLDPDGCAGNWEG